MEEFKPTKIDLSTINNGKGKYNNGDGIQANIINSVIEASAWAQSLGTNQPNIENIDKEGEPSVSIETTENGTPRLKFENLKGKKGTDGKDAVVDETLSVVGASADAKATGDRFAVVEKNNEKQDTLIKTLFSGLSQAEIIRAVEDVENTSIIRQTADGLSVIDGSQSTVSKIQGKTVKSANLLNPNGAIDSHPLYSYHPQNTGENRAPSISIVNNEIVCSNIWSGASACILFDKTYPAGTYTIKVDTETNDTDTAWRAFVTSEVSGWNKLNANIYWKKEVWIAGGTSGESKTFTATAPFKLGFSFGGTESEQKTYKNIMLNYGETALPYTPYFDGLKSAQISGIKSVSNLLKWKGRTRARSTANPADTPRTLSENEYWDNFSVAGTWVNIDYAKAIFDENSIKIQTNLTHSYGVGFPVKCLPNTQYSLSVKLVNKALDTAIYFLGATYYDKNGVFISYNSGGGNATTVSFTTPPNAEWVVVSARINEEQTSFEIADLMLNYGSTALPYREYEESLLTLPETVELGEWDSIDGKTLTKGTSEILTLNGTEGTAGGVDSSGWGAAFVNDENASMIIIRYIPPTTINLLFDQTPIVNNPYKGVGAWDWNFGNENNSVFVNNFSYASGTRSQIGVQVSKATLGLNAETTYTTEELTTAMLNYIKANPLSVASKLTTPIVTELNIDNEYLVWNKGQEKMLLGNTDAIPKITNSYYIVLGG